MVSEYEQQRLARIAANNAKLVELGLDQRPSDLPPPRRKHTATAASKMKKRPAEGPPAVAPRRVSSRAKGLDPEGRPLLPPAAPPPSAVVSAADATAGVVPGWAAREFAKEEATARGEAAAGGGSRLPRFDRRRHHQHLVRSPSIFQRLPTCPTWRCPPLGQQACHKTARVAGHRAAASVMLRSQVLSPSGRSAATTGCAGYGVALGERAIATRERAAGGGDGGATTGWFWEVGLRFCIFCIFFVLGGRSPSPSRRDRRRGRRMAPFSDPPARTRSCRRRLSDLLLSRCPCCRHARRGAFSFAARPL